VLMTILFAWLSYMCGEVMEVSPIVSCFACGIVLSHYNYYNMAADARLSFGTMSHACSEGAEAITFIYVGITVIADRTVDSPTWDPLFTLAALFSLVLSRGFSTFFLSVLANLLYLKGDRAISVKKMVTIWFAGLMRGVVAFAMALNLAANAPSDRISNVQRGVALTSTGVVVFFTTVVFGTLSGPLLEAMKESEEEYVASKVGESRSRRGSMASLHGLEADEASLGTDGAPSEADQVSPEGQCIWLVQCFKELDDHLLKKCFGGRHHSRSAHAEEMERRIWLASPGGNATEVAMSGNTNRLTVPLTLDMDGGVPYAAANTEQPKSPAPREKPIL